VVGTEAPSGGLSRNALINQSARESGRRRASRRSGYVGAAAGRPAEEAHAKPGLEPLMVSLSRDARGPPGGRCCAARNRDKGVHLRQLWSAHWSFLSLSG
jgi:hypothetical protein